MRPRPTAAVLLGALTLLLAACSSPSADPAADLRRQAASIDAAAQEVLTALQSAGFTEASARGIVDACQSEPAPGVAYRAGVTAKIGDAPEDAFETLLGELDANGWQYVLNAARRPIVGRWFARMRLAGVQPTANGGTAPAWKPDFSALAP